MNFVLSVRSIQVINTQRYMKDIQSEWLFCRSTDNVTNLYGTLAESLEEVDLDHTVSMFHAHLDSTSEEEIPTSFIDPASTVRCLITTIAFGLGMQIPDAKYVIHWGPPTSVLDYWQEVGRCARDGTPGEAILYTPPYSLHPSKKIDQLMLDIIKLDKNSCLRKSILQALKVDDIEMGDIESCCGTDRCCSHCDIL